jgi:serine/threonine protein kinase
VKGESLTHHSDLFSLGIVAYEFFCGENPFLGKDINSTINNILTFEENKIFKPLAELPVDISVAIEKMLQKSVNKRPASAGDILGILKVQIDADQTIRSRKNVIKKLGLTAASLGILLILFLILRTVYNNNSEKSESGSEFTEDINLSTTEYDKQQAVKPEISEQNGLNDNLAVAVTNKTVLTGKLYVESIPQVNILIDSLYSITTPFKDPFEISEGTHKLDWMHDDYPNYKRLIRIKSDQITFVNLHPDSIFGYLNCSIYPWGEVYIDDRYIGQSPFHKALIMPAGQHRVTIHNPGFLTFRDTLTILKNDTTDYKINLEQVSTIVNPN